MGYQVPPDTFQAINPIMILIFIPLFDLVIYPLLGEFHNVHYNRSATRRTTAIADRLITLTICFSKTPFMSNRLAKNSDRWSIGWYSICCKWWIRAKAGSKYIIPIFDVAN